MTEEEKKAPLASEAAKAEAPEEAPAKAEAEDDARDSKDDAAISMLLKKSLRGPEVEEVAAPKDSILPSVQRKLRQRSKGKFYGDGWSTTQSKFNYALVAILMLVVIGVCYLALGPTGFSAR